MSRVILGIDPGTRKAGYAVVDDQGRVLGQGIEPPEEFLARLGSFTGGRTVSAIALGSGTNSKAFRLKLAELGVPIHLVDESETSLQARRLYFSEHPVKGWRRLIPLGMQLPPCPIDDYAAILIARRYLAEEPTSPTS